MITKNIANIKNNKMLAYKRLSDFERLKILGKGSIGHVYLVKLKDTEDLFAMKVLCKKEMVQRNKVKRILTEQEILSSASSPFITTLYYSFQTKYHLCFIMKYYPGGDLYNFIKRQPYNCLTEKQTKFYSAEVLMALEYLHENGFIYRDLKPENILIDFNGHIALTDFDLAKYVTSNDVISNSVPNTIVTNSINTNSFVGTEEYMAPEVITGTGHNATVDWWTFGILIYEMLYGRTPFVGNSRDNTFKNICKSKVSFPVNSREPVSKECKSLIIALLKHDSKKRLGAIKDSNDIINMPFYADTDWNKLYEMTPPFIPKLRHKMDTRYFVNIVDNCKFESMDLDNEESSNDTSSSKSSDDESDNAKEQDAWTSFETIDSTFKNTQPIKINKKRKYLKLFSLL